MNLDQILEGIVGKDPAALGENELPDEVRNRTPEELHQIVELMDAHAKELAYGEHGELRSDLTAAEDMAFRYALVVREAARKRIEEHRNLSEVFSRRPERVKKVYANLRNGLEDHGSVARMTHSEARDAALRMLDDRTAGSHLRSDEKDQVERHIRRSGDLSRRIIVTENEHYRNAFMKMVTKPNGAIYLNEEERNAMAAFEEYRAQSTSDSAGGFAMPVFIDPSVIMTAQGSGNPFMSIARQVEINTDQWRGVSSAGVSWSFDAEASEVSDDAATIAQPTVDIFTARGFIPFSLEISEDWVGFAAEMQQLLAEGYDELLIDKFTRGAGTTEPSGVLTVLSASAGARVSITAAGTAFSSEDPYKVWKALPQRFRRRASWLMSVDVNNKFRQLGTANVFHAFTENLPAEWADTLFGKSVYESPYMPDTTTTTSGNTGLAIVGDFQNFLIARRTGMSIELVPHLFHTSNNRPSGQRGWFAYSRIGSNVINTFAFKLLVNTA